MKTLTSVKFILLMALCMNALLMAEDNTPVTPAQTTVTGTVKVTYGENKTVVSVTLTADKEVYNVVQDEKGKELVKLDGKKIEATGTVSKTETVKWLTVTSYKIVLPPAPKNIEKM
ncbi:MAG: hypothetical protein JW709_05985 [Sedimentisphaerales bacterium]|nr:hypothetical protein [Sedimentisphaerales bacterium]